MGNRGLVIESVRAAFAQTQHPGDAFLQGSFEGTEPDEVARAFAGITDWSHVDASTLDAQYTALGFLSEGGFRFFLPAYLIADLQGRLQTADPAFVLTHGFFDTIVVVPGRAGTHQRRIGKSAFVNPRRYGAMTWHDHARARLSVFTREECGAIVCYLEHRRDGDADRIDTPAIEAALGLFWYARAANAPTHADLRRHLEAEDAFVEDSGHVTNQPP